MNPKYDVLILGASYGSLFSTKLLLAGHSATLVCTPPTAEIINREGTVVRLPIRGRETPVEVASKGLEGTLSASAPDSADPGKFDLVVLAMQEPQYRCLGRFRAGCGHACEPRPASLSPTRRGEECPSSRPSDKLQNGPIRIRRAHHDAAKPGGRHQRDPFRSG